MTREEFLAQAERELNDRDLVDRIADAEKADDNKGAGRLRLARLQNALVGFRINPTFTYRPNRGREVAHGRQ